MAGSRLTKKRLLAALAGAFLLLVAILLVRTATFSSRQIAIEPAAKPAVDEAAATERLAGAVRIPTISPPDPAAKDRQAFASLHDYLAKQFPRAHAALSRETIRDISLLYTWKGADPSLPALVLLGHLDVVPVEAATEQQWTHPPFSGAVEGGFVWGRGTLDDKLNVCGLLEAAEVLLADGFQPKRTVYFAFGGDEEIGGDEGAVKIAALLQQRGVKARFILDEGMAVTEGVMPGIAAPIAFIGVAEKGYLSVELSADDTGGHSSMPPPKTTVGRLATAIDRLEASPMPAAIDGPVAALLSFVGPEMPFFQRLVMANLWLTKPLVERSFTSSLSANAMLRTTMAATMFTGGPKDNVLPAHATAVVNFRIHPRDSIQAVLSHMKETIRDPSIQLRAYPESSEPSRVSDPASPNFTLLTRAVRKAFPDAIVAPSLVLGTTDSHHYQALSDDVYRFSPIRLGPEDLKRLHGKDERISLKNYEEVIAFYVQIIRDGTD